MNAQQFFNLAAGIIFPIGFLPYIYSMLRGETKPSKVSWIIWISLDYIVLAGMFAENTVNGQIVGTVFGGTMVFLLALKLGNTSWTNLDKFSLAGGVVGIMLWLITSNPIAAIITSSCTALIGSFPTFASAWKNPRNENRLAWTLFTISCVCALIGVPHWTIADAAQPVAFSIVEGVMMYILWVKPRLEFKPV